MVTPVNIIRGSGLDREIWTFNLIDMGMRLTGYSRETRQSGRHKWIATATYDVYARRDATLTAMPVPDHEVINSALDEFRERIVYVGVLGK